MKKLLIPAILLAFIISAVVIAEKPKDNSILSMTSYQDCHGVPQPSDILIVDTIRTISCLGKGIYQTNVSNNTNVYTRGNTYPVGSEIQVCWSQQLPSGWRVKYVATSMATCLPFEANYTRSRVQGGTLIVRDNVAVVVKVN
jgi:hypothetical protein